METKNLKFKRGFRFPKIDFFTGIGSILDIQGNYYEFNFSESGEKADKRALASDWQSVGSAIKMAKKKFEEEYREILSK